MKFPTELIDSKVLINSIQEWLHLKDKAADEGQREPPMPAELFSADQMERYGITLALSHELVEKNKPDILLSRLSQSEDILKKSCAILNVKPEKNNGFSPASEWLLDNFYLIQEQIHSIRLHLPKGYGRSLPQLAGNLPGFPRVYDIALETIKHGDGRWDLENLSRFITAYQGVTPLTLGELWALPITLGVALIENLSCASKRIVSEKNDRSLANFWADKMTEAALADPKKIVLIIADMARSEPPMSSAFVAELARRLKGSALALPLTFIEQHLAEEGLSIAELVQEENKQQAANQITVSNSIAGLRHLAEVDWRHFVENMSLVEKILRTDPSEIYASMDFGTRDCYRHVIERLSRATKQPEIEVAEAAILLSKTKKENKELKFDNNNDSLRTYHVGYYLIDKGLSQLEKSLHLKRNFLQEIGQYLKRKILAVYLGSIFFITAILVLMALYKASQGGISIPWLFGLGLIIAICGSQLALAMVNLLSTLLVKPKSLPRMDFTLGIPLSFRTLVVVPSMLGSVEGVETQIEALEVRFLGNRDKNLLFALLTDFNDSTTEHRPEDEILLSLAKDNIEALNKRYASDNQDIFFLLHRPRRYNEHEKIWMGWERKRGKLSDLNNLLRGNNQSSFSFVVGNIEELTHIKYVITLDSDTQLSRESARQFVATMAHPLNRPCYDNNKQIVIDGYGILQPRIAETLGSVGPSRYVWLYGNEFGIDPYTRAVSDVYQDLFQEGSFIGKGIYDVDLFQQVLENRFPENQILSHDLLEGCYLRSGLLSDVPLYEKSPNSYLSDVKRRSRWIRGDWQIAGWLFPFVQNAHKKNIKNPLSLLSKMKIADNLRRSLVPLSLLLLLGLGWTVLPEHGFWLDLILTIILFPAILNTLLELLNKPRDTLASQHIAYITPIIRKRAGQLLFYLACLPFEAWYSTEAILRSSWRMLVSRSHLLEWLPSDQVKEHKQDKASTWFISMWVGPVFSLLAVTLLLINSKLLSLFFALPLLVLWLFSPLIAYWLSKPFHDIEPKLHFSQKRFLHQMARKTWNFFETFITEENHWLPPDNFQETPIEVLARRTSPTNMGLALLANLTAYDFGYITLGQLLFRTNNTLQSMKKLERYRSHFYNWYNTETLAPLFPRYISTVDSGNLAGHLLTLRQGLLALVDAKILNPNYLSGLEDTCDTLASKLHQELPEFNRFRQNIDKARDLFTDWSLALSACNELCLLVEELSRKIESLSQTQSNEAFEWTKKLCAQCQAIRDEIALYAHLPGLTENCTLKDIAFLDTIKFNLNFDKVTLAQASSAKAKEILSLIDNLAVVTFDLAQMDISFLYKTSNQLMTIGFNVEDHKQDNSSYDLLSSEARLGNFVSIAQGQILQESWFALGRLMVSSSGEPILLSWSGSMFEYLMPLLVMPTYPGTLLDQTYHSVVNRQVAYGKRRGVPWGISESGYNAVDTQFNYLYRAFGVPGLGLKRGLEEDLVIAPYASAMALMVAPLSACQNLQRLASEQTVGKYGFYEAIDYTSSRLQRDNRKAIVHSFMTHHQGMIFLSFSYLLHDKPMQKRFMADPLFQASILLLQERIPKPNASYLQIPKSKEVISAKRPEASMRVFNTPNTRVPKVQLLSNGRYHLVLTQAGGGYSRWKDLALTRWREDSTKDQYGLFNYVRDLNTGEFCSINYQPTQNSVENFKAVFSEGHAEFNQSALLLDLHTEVVVSPEDDIELRRIRIHNKTKFRRSIELTSYGEIVLAAQASDIAQPAFSNLFVETEIIEEQRTILARRRAQDDNQTSPWIFHLMNIYNDGFQKISFETDRARFIGRGRNLASPLAMIAKGDLSNTSGAVLDPIFSIRCRLMIEADAIITFDLLTGVSETREEALNLVEKYHDRHLANRIFSLAWTHSQVLLHQLNISEADAQLYLKIASAIIYMNSNRRAEPRILASNRKGQSGLWGYSISGDRPIALIEIEDAVNIELVRQLIQAQAYWQRKGLVVDLMILNKERISYRQTLQEQIMSLITTTNSVEHLGCIVVRNADQVSIEDTILLQSVARVVFSDKQGSLKEQLRHRPLRHPEMPLLKQTKMMDYTNLTKTVPLPENLQFYNDFGGFNQSGDEYVIRLVGEEVITPAPWANVIANPNFGTLLTESGQGYTFAENAHEFRLSPWNNDPIQDNSGEAFYLRDNETGKFWSPSVLPCRGQGDYLTRHGFGYSIFEHSEVGIVSELCITVPMDSTVKLSILKLRNDSSHYRRLSVLGYVAWVLGDTRTKNAMHVVTELSYTGAVLAYNHYNSEFSDRVAFFDARTSNIDLIARTLTGDRTEFLGRNGSEQKPEALERKRLSGRLGAGLDPCAAIELTFDLAPSKTREIVFVLGAGKNREEAEMLLQRFHNISESHQSLAFAKQYWQKKLMRIKAKTPDKALNLLVNGWLLYQTLSSRLWGRSGYYQSSGAFGYRDQLQDVMSLSQVAPELFREHILLCAAHQFVEGDVQHWWHPPNNRGLRSRCSDDFLWLPFSICQYCETTGDISILDEMIPFLQGRLLNAEEESYYDLPNVTAERVSLYEHAVRAINNGLKFGEHGLPLMGSGDWNDGMNLVGKEGKGESVWLGFFLYCVLKRFARLSVQYGDKAYAAHSDLEASKLMHQLELHGWDGEWYRRAYFDDGTPLGSIQNNECKIDSIAQSWAVLSKASDPIRSKQAMNALYQYLVSPENEIIKLLDPPFDKAKPNPGYIEGYVPGIRENGGQYTHAAIWAAMAFAELGETELAWKLFQLINPINHGRTLDEVERYKIEPYVVAGDVYSVAPHVGRGGWSWYTGSSGWMYRLIIETLLGIVLEEGKTLYLNPLLPLDWNGFTAEYYYKNTLYKIVVERCKSQKDKPSMMLDGVSLNDSRVFLQDDGKVHEIYFTC